MRAGIRVLGPLEAEVEGARADLGGPLQRAVLALLLMERGRVVSVDRMIDQLWRGEPPPRAIASLQAYVSNLRRLLALSLWACDRQADALAALRRARRILRDELGLEPGPALAEVEEAILGQHQEVLHRAQPPPAPAASRTGQAGEPARAQDDLFVGRGDELRAIAAAAARRAGGVVLITGEGGAGKSRLLDRAAGHLAETGWTVVMGNCPDAGGAPSAWAWTEALRALAEHVPPAEPAEVLGALLNPDGRPASPTHDAAAARFRLHQAVLAWLREAAAAEPVAVLLDDLHQADAETLALLETVAAGLGGSPLLLMAAYRPAAAGGELEQALAVLARRSPARLPLAGLPASDAAVLISSVYGGPVDEHIVQALGARTGGNPF